MDQKSLKTSWPQRIIIMVIALLLLGSSVFIYIFMVFGNSSGSNSTSETELAALEEKYSAKAAEVEAAAAPISEKYFDDFSKYLDNIKSYNSTAANSDGLKTTDLKKGTGKTLEEGDTAYYAYYIGYCADGSVFDSSFDDTEKPTKLKAPLDPSMGLIEGWNQGVIGMKLDGVREITIPGELAYGETQEICGGTNSPLKFIILPIEQDEELVKLNEELSAIYYELVYAANGTQM